MRHTHARVIVLLVRNMQGCIHGAIIRRERFDWLRITDLSPGHYAETHRNIG